MNPFPPPTVPSREPSRANFWQRRGRWGKAGVVGGGILAGLFVLAAAVPADESRGADAAPRSRTSDSPTDTLAGRDDEAPTTSDAPTTVVTTDEVSTTVEPVPTVVSTTIPATTTSVAAVPVTTAAPQPTISRVVDGDTVDMSDGTTIRLIGIDTPERGACGYDEAADTLGLILYGHTVTLVPGARDDVDRYGRLLRYLDLDDGTDVNLAMIVSGQAIARYDSRDGYGRHTREDAFVAADATSPAFCDAPVAPPAVVPFLATPPPAPAPAPALPAPSNVSYKNCDAVRAAGAAPIRAGDPGFQSKFDRDNDGVGCE